MITCLFFMRLVVVCLDDDNENDGVADGCNHNDCAIDGGYDDGVVDGGDDKDDDGAIDIGDDDGINYLH